MSWLASGERFPFLREALLFCEKYLDVLTFYS